MSEAGLLAEFREPQQLVAAAEKLRAEGYHQLDAHTPFPVPGLSESLGLPESDLPWYALAGGIAGGSGGYFMLWYSSVIHYPIHVAGRPLHSWPSFVPITFELTILCTAFTILFTLLYKARLTRLHQSVFGVPGFQLNDSRFFLRIAADDPKFDPERTRGELEALQPEAIHAIEA